jgi:hypothetical protein
MDPILITYGQMHPLNNAYQELLMLIALTINQYLCIQTPKLCPTIPSHK